MQSFYWGWKPINFRWYAPNSKLNDPIKLFFWWMNASSMSLLRSISIKPLKVSLITQRKLLKGSFPRGIILADCSQLFEDEKSDAHIFFTIFLWRFFIEHQGKRIVGTFYKSNKPSAIRRNVFRFVMWSHMAKEAVLWSCAITFSWTNIKVADLNCGRCEKFMLRC